jgi:MFS family permease
VTSQPVPHGSWSDVFRRDRVPAIVVLAGGVLLHSMNVLMLATVLPSIVGEMGGATMMAWPTTAYLASSIIAATCTGLITTSLGARATFAIGTLIFGIGALACALAPSMAIVVSGRFVQGLGGGMLTAVPYVLVRTTLPENLWARAIGLLSSMWSISILVGPMAGGAFARFDNWRGSFYTVAAIAAVLAVVALRVLPRATSSATGGKRPSIPGGRVALICLAIAILSSAAVVIEPFAKAALIVSAIAALILMMRLDRRAEAPLLPSDAFSLFTTTGLGLWMVLLLAIAYSPLLIYVPIFLQRLHGLDPLASGYVAAGTSIGWTLASIVVAGAAGAWPNRLILGGPLLMAVSLLFTAWLTAPGPIAALCVAVTAVGIGIGLPWSFIAERVMRGAREGEGTISATAVVTVQQMGFALGGAIAGLSANSSGLTTTLEQAGVLNAAFWTTAVFVVPAALAAMVSVRLVRMAPPLAGR